MDGLGAEEAPAAAAPPTVTEACRELSDTLFLHKESLTDSGWIEISNAAKKLYDAKRTPPASSSPTWDGVRAQITATLNGLQQEADMYRDQLCAATGIIDNLRKRKLHNTRCLSVVTSLAKRLGVTEDMIDAEFGLYGLLPQVLKDRKRQKRRKRDDDDFSNDENETEDEAEGNNEHEGDEGMPSEFSVGEESIARMPSSGFFVEEMESDKENESDDEDSASVR